MNQVVLDASAVLAVTLQEPGAEQVLAIANVPQPISSVNWSETVAKYVGRGVTTDEAIRRLAVFSFNVIAFDRALGHAAAAMALETKPFGLSFADRACLATAQSLRLPVLTADRRWAALKLGIEVRLIR